jgi:septal ring factor EnvC (AmiA/AmiB activator)
VPAATPTPPRSPEPPAGDGSGAAAPPKEPPPPAASDTEARPATIGHVRSLRRWLIVTAVWAVAATAIAVLAYLSANDDDEAQIADAGARASAVQRRVNQQVREFDQRLANLPQSTEVEGLDKRLKRIEKVFSRQDRQLVSVGTQLKEIDARLNALEDEAPVDGQNTTTTP